MRLLIAATLIALPTTAIAEVVPLRHGTYVRAGADCAGPAMAEIMTWDGIGFSGAHSHACRARLLARHGSTYFVSNDCIDAGVGPAPHYVAQLRITPLPHNAVRENDDIYHYCAPAALPPELRTRATR